MHNPASIYNKFSQLSVSTENRLTSDNERVYETEIGNSMLLTTIGFYQHSAYGAGRVSSPNSP